jgi:hypothetical protein
MTRLVQRPDDIDAMFIQTAQAMSATADRLTLIGPADSTLYICDRPSLAVGLVTNTQFLDLWAAGETSFATDPPRAVLSLLTPTADELPEVRLVLHDPGLRRDRLTYRVEIVDGFLPVLAGACALFIDPLGESLTPQLVVGWHQRRHRPHARLG